MHPPRAGRQVAPRVNGNDRALTVADHLKQLTSVGAEKLVQRIVKPSLLRSVAIFPVARLLTRVGYRNYERFVGADLVNDDVRKSIHRGAMKLTR